MFELYWEWFSQNEHKPLYFEGTFPTRTEARVYAENNFEVGTTYYISKTSSKMETFLRTAGVSMDGTK